MEKASGLICKVAHVAYGISSLLGCGSRSALLDQAPEEERSGGGGGGAFPTGGTAAGGGGDSGGSTETPCTPASDLNSGPTDWLNEVRLPPVNVDGFSVSTPSIVTTTRGVSLAYLLSPPIFDDPENQYSSGLSFSHSETPLDRPNPSFSFELVDPLAITGGDLTTDGDSFFICYRSSEGLKLATRTNGEWSNDLVVSSEAPANSEWLSRCVIDSMGAVHVVYEDSHALLHATHSQGTWSLDIVTSLDATLPVQALDLEVGADGVLHALWLEKETDPAKLKHAWFENGWRVEEVPTPSDVDDAALEVTSSGQAHVVLLERSLSEVPPFHGYRADDAWSFEALDSLGDLDGFGYVSFDVGPDDSAHVVIRARLTTYASNQTGAWESQLIGLSADDRINLAVDATGAAHLVSRYFNYPNNTAPHYKTNRSVLLDETDQNCDGTDGIDEDGDGGASKWSGGNDCDDSSAAIQECSPEGP